MKFRNKYRNVRTRVDGIGFASKAEAKYYESLKLLLAAKDIRGFIMQPTFRLGCPENVYRPDFLVFKNDGTVYAVDVKGVETSKFRRDKKLWKSYGPCQLHIVHGKNNEWVDPFEVKA